MSSANYCGICGSVVSGVREEDGEERERMTRVDELIEQFDFAIDAVVEARNYIANIDGFLASVPLQYLTPVDYARVHLASVRLAEELEKSFADDDEHEAEEASDEAAPEEAEQVRSGSDSGGRYSVPFEAGGSEVSGAKCPFGPWTYHESGSPGSIRRTLAWRVGHEEEPVLHVRL